MTCFFPIYYGRMPNQDRSIISVVDHSPDRSFVRSETGSNPFRWLESEIGNIASACYMTSARRLAHDGLSRSIGIKTVLALAADVS
jgi:hypothetical protein